METEHFTYIGGWLHILSNTVAWSRLTFVCFVLYAVHMSLFRIHFILARMVEVSSFSITSIRSTFTTNTLNKHQLIIQCAQTTITTRYIPLCRALSTNEETSVPPARMYLCISTSTCTSSDFKLVIHSTNSILKVKVWLFVLFVTWVGKSLRESTSILYVACGCCKGGVFTRSCQNGNYGRFCN